jgi:hypothetical protein
MVRPGEITCFAAFARFLVGRCLTGRRGGVGLEYDQHDRIWAAGGPNGSAGSSTRTGNPTLLAYASASRAVTLVGGGEGAGGADQVGEFGGACIFSLLKGNVVAADHHGHLGCAG